MVKLSCGVIVENVDLFEIDRIAVSCRDKGEFAYRYYSDAFLNGIDNAKYISILSARNNYHIDFIFNDKKLKDIISRVTDINGIHYVNDDDVMELINDYVQIFGGKEKNKFLSVMDATKYYDYCNIYLLTEVLEHNGDVICDILKKPGDIDYYDRTDKSKEALYRELKGQSNNKKQADLRMYENFRHAYRALLKYHKYIQLEAQKNAEKEKQNKNTKLPNITPVEPLTEIDDGGFEKFWNEHQDDFASIKEAEAVYYDIEEEDNSFSIFHK